jgi:hemerythrin-like domain-containing protein
MKRSEALAPLSRDHHGGLVVAERLRRATEETAGEAVEDFVAFWRADGRRHFRAEEEVLMPLFARHGDARHDAVTRVLADHVEIRRFALELEAEELTSAARLREVGELLRGHIRHEERVLFPMIEEALPEAELSELASAVERAERES